MGIIKLTTSSISADSVLLEPIGIIGKLDINSDVTFNEIDTIRYSTYEPQVSTVHIPQLETDNAYDYFTKLTNEVKALNIQSQEYYNNINYSATQLLNKYNNVNSPDGSITLLDLLNIIRTTYVALNDTIFYNDGVYKKLIFDNAEQITIAMGQLVDLGTSILEVEAGLTIRVDQVRAYVDQTYTDAFSQIHTLNQLVIDTQGITLSAIQDKLDVYGNYVYKNYTSLQVFNDKIALLVGRDDFNDQGLLIAKNTSAITQLSNEISFKVDSVTFDGLSNIVSTATADIVIMKDSITSKVSTQSFEQFQISANTYFDIVVDHETRITQLPGQIELSVKTSYIDGLISDLTELDGKNTELTTTLTDMGVDVSSLETLYNSMNLGLTDLQTTTTADHVLVLAQGSAINAVEKGLALTATKLSVDTLTDRVTTNEAAIVASATKIGLLVSENNVILAGVIVDAINNGTVTIAANKINIDGTTTFSSGYNPSNKNTVFRSQPIPPYKEGDTWIKDSEYYTSSATRLEGGFVLADWYKSTKYTDDSVANGMSATYRDGTDPAYNWLTDIDKDNHVNDHWIATDLTVTDKGPVTKIYTKTINGGVTTYAWQLDQTYIDGGRILTNELLAQNIYSSGATIGGFTIGKDVNNAEYMRTSNQYLPNPTVGQSGIWMGFTEGTPKFFIGNSDEYITFNGTNLIISGYTRLGTNDDSISFGDLALFNKYFKIVNPDMENEYIQVVSNFCATGEVSGFRGGTDVFPPHIWDSIPVAGIGAGNNLGVIRIGTSLTIDEYGVVNVAGGVGSQTLGLTGTTLSLSGGNSVDLSSLTPTWSNITNKPTTIAGYGITDASINTHSHTTADITELNNLYYTADRARAACAASGTVYDSSMLGGISSTYYTRRNIAETISQPWAWSNNITAKQLGITETTLDGYGISLYNGLNNTILQSGKYFPNYGLFFGLTNLFGTHGYTTGDVATYFTLDGTANRGWIFKANTNNVFSISNAGNVYTNGNFNATNDVVAGGKMVSGNGANGGFTNAVHVAGANRIWSFGNAVEYGIYYNQGGADYIYMPFGSHTSPKFKFDINGNFTAVGEGSFLKSSDRNLKDNIQVIKNASSFIRQLIGVEYDWNEEAIRCNPNKANNRHHASFIAQDWEKVFPWATHTIYEKYKAIDDSIMIPYLTAGWNEHDVKIHNLEKDNLRLNKELQQVIDKLNLINSK